jgi:Tfp pilus assembly protein PilX
MKNRRARGAGRTPDERGQVLAGVVLLLALLLIIVPAAVKWMQQDTKMSVKNSQSSTAFNLAEAAIDRGMWKLKSSTATWDDAATGIAPAGYNFDVTYNDVPGGTYRVKLSSYTGGYVEIWGEGRDGLRKETRSIKAVYANLSVPGAIMAGGALSEAGLAIVHWGPILAWNTITISGTGLNHHYPRKLSKQTVVSSPSGSYDTNGLTPPNTDNLEWWSDYDVPDLPLLDFNTLRSSAIATNTLNCYGNYDSNTHQVPCNVSKSNDNVKNIYKDNRNALNYVWYWDNSVNMITTGIKGTTIVRGNLYTSSDDMYNDPGNADVNLKMPSNAWIEYQKVDTSAKNNYPGDIGLQSSNNYYRLGSCSSSCEGSLSGGDLGFYGFVYVGGDVNFQGDADIYGAVWVVGSWSAAGNNLVFYDSTLTLPKLNVVLVRQSWQETSPSGTAWP